MTLSANEKCQLWTGCRKGKFSDYGVINCQFECGYRKVTVHRLSLLLEPGLDASHLCHNSLCLTANHISVEPHSINNNRQYCVRQNVCFGHAPFPKCILQFKVFQCSSKTYIFQDILNPSDVLKCRLPYSISQPLLSDVMARRLMYSSQYGSMCQS